MDKNWDWWTALSSHPNITVELFGKYQDKPWNWNIMSLNPNLTTETLDKYIDCPWDFDHILLNTNLINLAFIEKHIDIPWCWVSVSYQLHRLH